MQIGILVTGHMPEELRPRYRDYADMFARLLDGNGFTFRAWHVVDMEFPPDVGAADGWLLTGSRHGAYERHLPFIPPLEEFIRAAYGAHVPMVGICFGHQIIAQALGGLVEKFSGGWSVGPQEYDLGGTRVRLNAWHQDQVIEPPPGAQVIGTSSFCRNAALLYPGRAFTVQAHPEFGPDVLQVLIENRGRGVIEEQLLSEAAAGLAGSLDQATLAARIAAFFRETAGARAATA
ncbi:MAG: type 1 glutamine amidotransferase [Rhodobacteraceae bacterium]|nr:type 1 glutamine amidotransferase [Paracoccaceae bacterium]